MKLKVSAEKREVRKYRRKDVPIEMAFYRFRKNRKYNISSKGKEQVLTLLKGEIRIEGDAKAVLKRKDVFHESPSAVYIGNGKSITVYAQCSGEFLIAGCRVEGEGTVEVIRRVQKEKRGKRGYKRTVYNIIPEEFPAGKLVLGETINDEGNWSSYPPHKHDVNSKDEVRMQEVYFFKLDPEDGFGFQRVYDNRTLDNAMTIRNNDLVWIPKGYHPVAVMPGHRIYYFWALTGDSRKLLPKTEKKYEWLL